MPSLPDPLMLRMPFARHLLRFRDVFLRHDEKFHSLSRRFDPLRASKIYPHVRENIILSDASTRPVHDSQATKFRARVT